MVFSVARVLSKAQQHAKRGEILQARAFYGQILERFPKNAKALKGIALLPAVSAAPVDGPSQAELHHLVGLFRAGKFAEVDQYAQTLTKRFPHTPVIHNIQGMAHVSRNANAKAILCFDRALKLNPKYTEALYNRGIAQRQAGRLNEAIASFQLAIAIAPQNAAAFYNIGHILLDQGRFADAEENLIACIDLDPNNADAFNNLGNAMQQLGKVREAIPMFERALALDPTSSQALSNLGIAQMGLGDIDHAKASFQKALALNPQLAETHKNLSDIVKYTNRNSQIEAMGSLLSVQNLSDTNSMYLHFALGKAEGELKNFADSFAHLKAANALRKKMSGYVIEQDRKLFAQIKRQFSDQKNAFGKTDSKEDCAFAPIFVLGMPRSGTSLVEQILASHSQVEGQGELELMSDAIAAVGWPKKPADAEALSKMRAFYRDGITARNKATPRFTDKMPANFRWIGFILACSPNAKIIHIKRDPRATCWSIYKSFFNSNGNGYAYDLGDIAAYYMLYEDLMEFWEMKFPHQIHRVNYEALTLNQEVETRKLLQVVDLPWEEKCLDFHKLKRVVQTTSATQVREKMYKGSSNAWRDYEEYLGELLTKLNV